MREINSICENNLQFILIAWLTSVMHHSARSYQRHKASKKTKVLRFNAHQNAFIDIGKFEFLFAKV